MGDFIFRLLVALSVIAYSLLSLLSLLWISWQLVNLVSW